MAAHPTPTDYLTGAIEDLCRVAGNSALLVHLLGPVAFHLAVRLRRLARRFAGLMAQFAAGTLAPPRSRTPRTTATRPSQALRFPTRQGWLIRALTATAFFQSRLNLLLADPQVQALITAHPARAGRILRPLCRMVMVDAEVPAALRLPRRPRKPRPPAAPRLRQRPRRFTRAQIDRMTAAELTHLYGRLPPHFPLPIPNLNYIRRKIAAG